MLAQRNRHALREFWPRAPADALGVKQELEKALAPDGNVMRPRVASQWTVLDRPDKMIRLFIGSESAGSCEDRSLASKDKLKRVSSAELDGLLDRARSEHWPQLVLLGPDIWFSTKVEVWPDSLKAANQVFWLDTFIDELDSKLESLPSLSSLILLGNRIGDEGAKAIAASLPGLTSLDLGSNDIG